MMKQLNDTYIDFWLDYMLYQHRRGHMATFVGGRPQLPLHALFQAQTGTQVEPFHNVAGLF
jgi:hypothetical protein